MLRVQEGQATSAGPYPLRRAGGHARPPRGLPRRACSAPDPDTRHQLPEPGRRGARILRRSAVPSADAPICLRPSAAAVLARLHRAEALTPGEGGAVRALAAPLLAAYPAPERSGTVGLPHPASERDRFAPTLPGACYEGATDRMGHVDAAGPRDRLLAGSRAARGLGPGRIRGSAHRHGQRWEHVPGCGDAFRNDGVEPRDHAGRSDPQARPGRLRVRRAPGAGLQPDASFGHGVPGGLGRRAHSAVGGHHPGRCDLSVGRRAGPHLRALRPRQRDRPCGLLPGAATQRRKRRAHRDAADRRGPLHLPARQRRDLPRAHLGLRGGIERRPCGGRHRRAHRERMGQERQLLRLHRPGHAQELLHALLRRPLRPAVRDHGRLGGPRGEAGGHGGLGRDHLRQGRLSGGGQGIRRLGYLRPGGRPGGRGPRGHLLREPRRGPCQPGGGEPRGGRLRRAEAERAHVLGHVARADPDLGRQRGRAHHVLHGALSRAAPSQPVQRRGRPLRRLRRAGAFG